MTTSFLLRRIAILVSAGFALWLPTIAAAALPQAPFITSISPGAGQLTIYFDVENPAPVPPVTSYTATCGTVSITGTASPLVVTGLSNNVAYTCRVIATSAAGDSPPAVGIPISPLVGPPSAPTIGGVTAAGQRITVSFTPPINNGGSPITSYTASCGGISATGTASPITVSGLVNGTAYTCHVTATSSLGTSPASAESVPITPTTGTPAAPTITSVTAASHQVTIAFSTPDDGGSPITSYAARCRDSSGKTFGTVGAASPLTLTGLTNLATFYCSVTASNALGAGAASSELSAMPMARLARTNGVDLNGTGIGQVVVRLLNSSTYLLGLSSGVLGYGQISDPGFSWRIAGAGDFDKSNTSDLVLTNIDTGAVALWINNGSFFTQQTLRTVKAGWEVAAIADVDGDGYSDIIWRFVGAASNPSNPDDIGVVFVWYMNGTGVDEVKNRSGAPLSWRLVGAGDIDGSGTASLIWQTPDKGLRVIRAQPGRTFFNDAINTNLGNFDLLTVADFDGDTKAELLLHSSDGQMRLRHINGAEVVDVVLPNVDPTWQYYTTADLNGDGTVDILWKKPDGNLAVWLMNAGQIATPTVLTNAGFAFNGGVVVAH